MENVQERPQDYERRLFRTGKKLQSAELNELEAASIRRDKDLGDALFRDGAIIRDCACTVNPLTGEAQLGGGALYLSGRIRGVAPATFVVPIDQSLSIGVRLVSTELTEIEEPSLLNPAPAPALGSGEPGAGRLAVNASWAWSGDGAPGGFYPVYAVENGVLLLREPPPQLEATTQALARYDRDSSGGSYVVEGLAVSAAYDRVLGKLIVLVGEGRARVNGYGIEVPASVRMVQTHDRDLKAIVAEPKTFTPGGGGTMRVNLDHSPLVTLTEVRMTAEKTVTVTRGVTAGGKDTLPDTSILSLVEVKQGATTFVAGTSYNLTAGQVDWAPAGPEPATGSSYTVKYQYLTTAATISGQDDTGFTIGGAVAGSLFTVDYSFALPRIDAVVADDEGRVSILKGVASQYAPAGPGVPASLLKLASLHHTWAGDPAVVADAVVVMPMAELQVVKRSVRDLFDLVAQERLKTAIGLADPAAKRGVFVDPLTNDNLRDMGIAQTAAVVDGELRLPISATVTAIGTSVTAPVLLEYTLEPVIEQTARTGSMLVNPYQAFDPLPGAMLLSPEVDFWTEGSAVASGITMRFVQGWGGRSQPIETIRVTEEVAEFLRPIEVHFTLSGFGAGEVLSTLTFDGVAVTPLAP